VVIGKDVLNGKRPASPMVLIPSALITRDNVTAYKGWSAPR
jgi:ribose transport system substrate-binding protein